GKREPGWDEKEIEGGDIQHRREDGGTAPEAQTSDGHTKQVDHYEIYEREARINGEGHACASDARCARPDVAFPPDWRNLQGHEPRGLRRLRGAGQRWRHGRDVEATGVLD